MARINQQSPGGAALSIGAVSSGTLLSFAATAAGSLLLALAVALTEWEGLDAGYTGFSYVCIALGGMLAAKRSRALGWLHGGLVGIAYFVVAAALFQDGFALAQFASSAWLVRAWWNFAAGAVGGVLGVNL